MISAMISDGFTVIRLYPTELATATAYAEGHADGEIVVDDNVEIADSGDIEFEIDGEEEIGVAIDAAPRQSAQMQRLNFSNDTGSSSRTGAVLGEIIDGQGLDFSKAGEMDLCALQNDDKQHISGSSDFGGGFSRASSTRFKDFILSSTGNALYAFSVSFYLIHVSLSIFVIGVTYLFYLSMNYYQAEVPNISFLLR
ncbi:hypothetical protein H0E87_030412 [Populus deltoides]|uniref:Uncharacterized protein n=1 Tax=Populus deltoides TaxID=3696 RepID=A0A8T2WEZ0_POPDE|nr:hypothetical protein H0E87_030412 [Populus deltoides]KAH8480160.1 hypothetical protein H0E87_030412 [Populus deltoides]KAH8480161.1 hypothetical protein H0E87_030412 [Populus deltoides]KAH8480162.1 hypothetical protein H0E87_030412 [Populus deltoides]